MSQVELQSQVYKAVDLSHYVQTPILCILIF